MARRLKLEIGETVEYLEKSLKQPKSATQKERLQLLGWLKTRQVSQAESQSPVLPDSYLGSSLTPKLVLQAAIS